MPPRPCEPKESTGDEARQRGARTCGLAVLRDGKHPAPAYYEAVRTAANALRLTLLPLTVDDPVQLAPAFATFTRQ
jgi:hypothetical protein